MLVAVLPTIEGGAYLLCHLGVFQEYEEGLEVWWSAIVTCGSCGRLLCGVIIGFECKVNCFDGSVILILIFPSVGASLKP